MGSELYHAGVCSSKHNVNIHQLRQFGGNPKHVVIHGQSAGAESVSVHLTAYGGQNQNLFVGAVTESLPQLTQLSISEVQFQYTALTQNTGCSTENDTLSCIRGLNITNLQEFNQGIAYPGRTALPLWGYVPVVDGSLLETPVYEAFEKGKFIKVPTIIGDVTNEGSDFAPNASTAAAVETFFQNQYPYLSSQNATEITVVYPETVAPQVPNHNSWFPAASLAYGDALFNCPGINFARYIIGSGEPVWMYRFNVLTASNEAAGLGVPHGFDLTAIFGGSYADSDVRNTIRLMGYYISFVRSLDPSTYVFPGSPSWGMYNLSTGGTRLVINNNNTATEVVPSAMISRCNWWETMIGPMQV